MLGELIGESKGKLLGTRVLPTEGQLVRVEVSIQGSGNLLGEDITDVGTYWQAIKPGGVLYGEGHVVMMAKDGAVADWTGYGLGSPAGPPPAAHYGVCGLFHSVPDRWARLLRVAMVNEFDTDAGAAYHWKMWEWK